MRPPRRAAVLGLALVPLGTLAGHVAGYSLAGQDAGLDGRHAHLRPAAWLAVASALGAVGWLARGRAGPLARVPVGWLAGVQGMLFLALEGIEHLAAGHGPEELLAEPTFRWGLAAQVATAAALVLTALVARFSGDRVRALLSGRSGGHGAAGAGVPPVVLSEARSLILASPASERGPPCSLVPV